MASHSRITSLAQQQRSRYTERFAPLERRFMQEARATPGERAEAKARTGADVSQAAGKDFDARLRGRMLGGNTSSTGLVDDITENAMRRGRAGSVGDVATTRALDQGEDRGLDASIKMGQGLLTGALDVAGNAQRLDEAEERSKYKFDQDRTAMIAGAVGNFGAQAMGSPGGQSYLDAYKTGGFSGVGDLFSFNSEAASQFPASKGWSSVR